MNIKTLFKVNDIVVNKFNRQTSTSSQVMEVMEIHNNTCYAGTQVFYFCRIYTTEVFKPTEPEVVSGHSLADKSTDIGWHKYREDELREADIDEINILTKQKAI